MENTLSLPTTNLLEKAQAIFDTMDVSEGTRWDYKKSVKAFVSFINGKNLTHNSFLDFKLYLKSRNDIGVSAKNKYLIAGRILLKEMNRTGLLPTDITQNIKGFEQGRKHKKDGLSEVEMSTLCQKIREMDGSFESMRFKAIVSLLIFQGLRQKEITGIDVSDIDLKRCTANIIGKGRDDYETIHLHPDAVKMVGEYMTSCNIASGPLFFSRSNRGRNGRLCAKSLRRIVTNELKALDIDKSTHGFRHYFTTKLIDTFKGDLLRVAEFTRHKTLDMLQVYNDARLTSESLPKFYGAFEGARIF